MIALLQQMRARLRRQPKSASAMVDDLIAAVVANDVAAVRNALALGAPIDGKSAHGATALTTASARGLAGMVRTLLELGADTSVTNDEKWIALDYARHAGNMTIENMLELAERGDRSPQGLANASRCGCGTCRDLATFIDHADLVLPKAGWKHYREKIKSTLGADAAADTLARLEATGYRALFEQIYGSEALACALPWGGNFNVIRSPMALGSYDLDFHQRTKGDVPIDTGMYDAADQYMRSLLPDDMFETPPSRVCEIGGAWGGTINHLRRRFPNIEEYQNYEPDRHYAQWAAERFGVKNMPVDGETLSPTETDSVDLVVANNVFHIVPPFKIWSYLMEMRRVIRRNGIIAFNAVVSDQFSEQLCKDYLTGYFPRRTFQVLPRDFIDRTFPPPDFELLKIDSGQFFVFRRTS